METLSKDRADKLEREFLGDLREDYCGIWELADLIEEELGTGDTTVIRESTMDVVRDMLARDLMLPGLALNDGNFSPWSMAPFEAADKINAEWEALGRTPTLGEGVWFDLTPTGEAYAERLGE